MRVGLFKPVHVKTLIAQEQRMLLTSRKLVQRKLMDIESDMRGTLRNFGLKVGAVSSIRYEARIRDLVEGFPRLAAIIMLRAMLYEAAQSMLTHSKKWSWLKAWGMRVAQRRGMGRASWQSPGGSR